MLGVHCKKEVATRRGCLDSFKHQHACFRVWKGKYPAAHIWWGFQTVHVSPEEWTSLKAYDCT